MAVSIVNKNRGRIEQRLEAPAAHVPHLDTGCCFILKVTTASDVRLLRNSML